MQDRADYHNGFACAATQAVEPEAGNPMMILLSQIPETGLRSRVIQPLQGLARLVEVSGDQNAELTADVLLKNHGGHVAVTADISASLRLPCQRCLEPVPWEVREQVRVTLVPESHGAAAPHDVHLGPEDLDVSYYAGEQIDLTAVLEDELLLLVPEAVCGEDERGCCTQCGLAVEDVLRRWSRSAEVDPRLAPLLKMIPAGAEQNRK
jgi:uncharacterized protein